ncbi:MAG TPA: hypothetical protein VGL26_01665 [Jatrophihabitans sp.]|jgi:hypothetical protein
MGKAFITLAIFVVATLAYLIAPVLALLVAVLAYLFRTRAGALTRAGKPRPRRSVTTPQAVSSGFGSGGRR